MPSSNVEIPAASLESFCHKWRVRELSLFGSVLRDDFGPGSDVDVLVSFADDAPWSLWDLTAMGDELATLGRGTRGLGREGRVAEPISPSYDLGNEKGHL